MEGREVYRHACPHGAGHARGAERSGLTVDDVDLFVAHQANARIIEAAAAELGVRPSRVVLNIDRVANTSSASIPLALAQAERDGRCGPAPSSRWPPSAPASSGARRDRAGRSASMSAPEAAARRARGHRRHARHRRGDRRRLRDEGFNVATARAHRAATSRPTSPTPSRSSTAFDQVRERFGPILVLVNNAGVRHDGLTIRMPAEEWERSSARQPQRRLPLHAPRARRHAQGALGPRDQRLVRRRRARQPGPGQLRAAKAGLLGLHPHARARDGRKGVTCNAVTPGRHRDRT
jgi:hypothetical protein